jgi:hypothetical protein
MVLGVAIKGENTQIVKRAGWPCFATKTAVGDD